MFLEEKSRNASSVGASDYIDMAALNEEEEDLLTEEMADLFLPFN